MGLGGVKEGDSGGDAQINAKLLALRCLALTFFSSQTQNTLKKIAFFFKGGRIFRHWNVTEILFKKY